MDSILSVVLCGVVTLALGWVLMVVLRRNDVTSTDNDAQTNGNKTDSSSSKKKKTSSSANDKKPPKGKKPPVREVVEDKVFTHPWLVTSLKGHSSPVLNLHLSSNGKFLASCAQDRAVLIWMTKDFASRDHKQIRVNIEFDSAGRVQWSPDNKAFVISKSDERTLEVFKLGKKADGSIGNIHPVIKYKQVHHAEIIGLGIACNGNFLMSGSSDNKMIIWDLKGRVLAEIDTALMKTYSAKVSPCGRYVAACGLSPDVTVHNVLFTADGEYREIVKIWQLKGHQGGVYNLDFNNDSSLVATIAHDGIWRLFDTTGNRVDIKRKGKVDIQLPGEMETIPIITISHDSRIIIIGVQDSITIFSALSGNHLSTLEAVHSDPIREMIFSVEDKYFVSCGDRSIRVFNNVSGLEETVMDLTLQIKDNSISAALRNRLAQELEQVKKQLKTLKE